MEQDLTAIYAAFKRKGIKVNNQTKVISIPANADLGVKTWSKIDYLCNHLGYKSIKTNESMPVKREYNDDAPKKRRRKDNDSFGIKHNIKNVMKF